MVGIPFLAVMRVNNGIAMASSRFALGYLPGNIVRPVLFLTLMWLLWLNHIALDSELAMLVQFFVLIAVAILTSVLMRFSTRQLLSQDPPIMETRTWNRAAISLLGVELFTGFFQQITVIVSGLFLPSADVGIYNVGYRIALLITFTLMAIDSFTVTP